MKRILIPVLLLANVNAYGKSLCNTENLQWDNKDSVLEAINCLKQTITDLRASNKDSDDKSQPSDNDNWKLKNLGEYHTSFLTVTVQKISIGEKHIVVSMLFKNETQEELRIALGTGGGDPILTSINGDTHPLLRSPGLLTLSGSGINNSDHYTLIDPLHRTSIDFVFPKNSISTSTTFSFSSALFHLVDEEPVRYAFGITNIHGMDE